MPNYITKYRDNCLIKAKKKFEKIFVKENAFKRNIFNSELAMAFYIRKNVSK